MTIDQHNQQCLSRVFCSQLSQLIRNVWICGRIDSSSIIAHPIYTTGTIAKIRCQEVDISIIDRYNSFDNRYGFFVSNGNTTNNHLNVHWHHIYIYIHKSSVICVDIEQDAPPMSHIWATIGFLSPVTFWSISDFNICTCYEFVDKVPQTFCYNSLIMRYTHWNYDNK